MKRQHACELTQAISEESLDRASDLNVEVLSPLLQDRVVDDFLSQGVLECVRGLSSFSLHLYQANTLKILDPLVDVVNLSAHFLENSVKELTTDHCSDLQDCSRVVIQSVDAS